MARHHKRHRGRGARRWQGDAPEHPHGVGHEHGGETPARILEARVGPCVGRLFTLPDRRWRAWVIAPASAGERVRVSVGAVPCPREAELLGCYVRGWDRGALVAVWVPEAAARRLSA